MEPPYARTLMAFAKAFTNDLGNVLANVKA